MFLLCYDKVLYFPPFLLQLISLTQLLGINQLFLFGTYDQLKYALFNKGHHESINSHEAVLLVCDPRALFRTDI